MPTSNSFLSLPPHLKLSGSVNTAKKNSWYYRHFWTLEVEAISFFSCYMAKSFLLPVVVIPAPPTSQMCCLLDYFWGGLGNEISSTVQFSVRSVKHKELNNEQIVYFSTGLSVSQALYNVLSM